MNKKNIPPAKKAKSKSPSKARRKTKKVVPQPIRMAEEVTEEVVADSMRKIGGGGNVNVSTSTSVSKTKMETKDLQAQREWLEDITKRMEDVYRITELFSRYRNIPSQIWPDEHIDVLNQFWGKDGENAPTKLRDIYIALSDQSHWEVEMPGFLVYELGAVGKREVVPAQDAVEWAEWFEKNSKTLKYFTDNLAKTVRSACIVLANSFKCWGKKGENKKVSWRVVPREFEWKFLGIECSFEQKTLDGDLMRQVTTSDIHDIVEKEMSEWAAQVCDLFIGKNYEEDTQVLANGIRWAADDMQNKCSVTGILGDEIWDDTYKAWENVFLLDKWLRGIGEDEFADSPKKERQQIEAALSVILSFSLKHSRDDVKEMVFLYQDMVSRNAGIKAVLGSESGHQELQDVAPKGDGDDIMIEDSDSVEEQRRKRVEVLLRIDFEGKSSVTYAEIGKVFGYEARSSFVKKQPLEFQKDASGNYLTREREKKDGTLVEEKIPVMVMHKTDMCEAARRLIKKWKLKPTRAKARPPKFSCQKVAKKIAEDEFPE
jgi:hypothetical protein